MRDWFETLYISRRTAWKFKNRLISLDIAITIINTKSKNSGFVWATQCYIVTVGYTSKFSWELCSWITCCFIHQSTSETVFFKRWVNYTLKVSNASILERSHYIIINKGVKFTQFHATEIWTLENAHFIIEKNVNTAEILFLRCVYALLIIIGTFFFL